MQGGSKAGIGALAGVLMWSGQVMAAGFELREQSAIGQGASMAGAAARGDDPSFIFFNPAAMAWLSGTQLAVVGSGIFPHVSADSGRATRNAALGGSPITGSLGGEIGVDGFVPAAYMTYAANDRVHLGVGLTVPWGLSTKSSADFIGRYHAQTSSLRTINLTPAISWRVLDNFAIGAGVQIQNADTRLTSAVDYGAVGAAAGLARLGLLPGSRDGITEVSGDDTAFGWQIGAQWEPMAGTRVGASFRSAVFHRIRGDAEFQGVPAEFQAVPALRAAFANTGAGAELVTPETAHFGISHQLGTDWTLLAGASWTNWSRFRELLISFDNGRPASVTEERWADSWFLSAGAEYRWNEQLTLRAGLALDQSPVREADRTPRIPDNDRYWLSFGASYQLRPGIVLSAAYTHIFVEDSTVALRDPGPNNTNQLRGNLNATYRGSVDIVTAQLRFAF
jgi:long-chain fatty acid transport protein